MTKTGPYVVHPTILQEKTKTGIFICYHGNMSRFFFLLCVALVAFSLAPHANAVSETIYWNDSDLINFPANPSDGGTPDDGGGNTEDSGGVVDTGTSGLVDTSNTGGQTPSQPAVPSTPASEAVVSALGSEAVVTVVSNDSNAGSSKNLNTGGQDLLTVLSSGGAIEIAGSGGGSTSGNLSEDTSAGIRIVGANVRGSLRSNGIFLRMLADLGGFGAHAQTRADVGLIAASTALTNSNIEEVFFKLHEFIVTYRSRGYLLGFVPVSYTVRVTVNPELTAADRVKIKLPWYRFFLRKLFSPDALARDINAIVAAHIQNSDPEQNLSAQQAQLFVAVANLLKSKIDVVEESVGKVL